MKILVLEIFEKGQILRPFLGLALSKLKILYSTHQFSEESKGGVESTPPRSLRYRKKRGPERVKYIQLTQLIDKICHATGYLISVGHLITTTSFLTLPVRYLRWAFRSELRHVVADIGKGFWKVLPHPLSI